MNEMPKKPEPKIRKSLQAVNDELKTIGKDQQGYNYKFRGIDDVLNVVGPLLKKHKIIVRRTSVEFGQFPNEKMNHVWLKCLYSFVSTEDCSELTSWGFGEGMDKGDKAIGCATSNAYKYVIFEMFNIPTEEQMDSDQKTAKENKVEAPKKVVAKATPKAEDDFRKNKVKKTGEL